MSGEITLRGEVLPIGGLKEKVLAANGAGLPTVIVPKQNERDLIEVPRSIRQNLTFHFVEDMEEVLKLALAEEADERVKPFSSEAATRWSGEAAER